MLKPLSWVLGLCLLATSNTASASGAACRTRFMNPISDICWECIFPITLGSVPLIPSKRPDTKNPTMPISFCPKPPPIFMQVGLNIGYWEPYAITDVTRVPFCMVNLGFSLGGGMSQQIGGHKHP